MKEMTGLSTASNQCKRFYIKIDADLIYLTAREKQITDLLTRYPYLTYAEVAKRMKLSSRTIEYYTQNIKTKLSCRNKRELINKLLILDVINNVDINQAKHGG